jgi:hypothetical protein
MSVNEVKPDVAMEMGYESANAEVVSQRFEIVKRTARTQEDPRVIDTNSIYLCLHWHATKAAILRQAKERGAVRNRRNNVRLTECGNVPDQPLDPKAEIRQNGIGVTAR